MKHSRSEYVDLALVGCSEADLFCIPQPAEAGVFLGSKECHGIFPGRCPPMALLAKLQGMNLIWPSLDTQGGREPGPRALSKKTLLTHTVEPGALCS